MKVSRFPLLVFNVLLWLAICSPAIAQSVESPGEENTDKPSDPKPAPKPKQAIKPEFTLPPEPERVEVPIIIQGTVITEDGGLPPFGTVIERDCGVVVVKEVLVNSNGFFSFRIGDEDRAGGLFADASQNYYEDRVELDDSYTDNFRIRNTKRRDDYPEYLLGCYLQANYTGYRSTYAKLGTEQKTGLIDVGTIIMYPVSRRTGTVVSVMNLKAPKSARNALKDGKKAFEKNEYDKAEQYFKSALSLYPKYVDAWIELGWLNQKQKNYEEARKSYTKALELDKLYVNPYIRIAQLSAIEHRWEDSIKYSDKALALDTVTYPEVFFLKALAHYNLDQLDLAEEIVRRGIRIDLKNKISRMYLLLANILVKKGDPSGSIEAMREYLKINPSAPDSDNVRALLKEYKKIVEAEKQGEKDFITQEVAP